MSRQEVTARYRARHPDRVRAANRAWRRKPNPWMAASRAVWKARWRARAFGLPTGDLTKETMARLHLLPCTYCGVMPANGADHIVPMSRGGPNTVANLAPCCLSCNHRKYNKLVLG